MSIEFTILAFLSAGPLSGYDLKKLFAESEALPWSGNNNQVYRALVGLHRDGLASLEVRQPAEGPARKLYTITTEGITALGDWLRSGIETPQLRAPILSRLIAADVLPAEDLDLLLSRYAEEVRLKLLGLEELERRGGGPAFGSARQRLLWERINSRPIQLLRAEEEWVRELRWALARFEKDSSRWNPALNYVSEAGFEQAMAFYDHAIAAWPMPAEPRTVITRFGDTFVLSWGDPGGPPLVLLHGSAANSSTWAFDAATLGASFRVHAVDLPGETGKSTGYRPPYDDSAYPDWLSDVFDELGLGSAPIAGLSLGGWVALKFAAAHAARVEKLVLLAPGGVAPAREAFEAAADSEIGRGEAGIRRLVSALFEPHSPPPGVAEAFVFMHSIYKTRRDTLPVLTDEELDRIAVPALLLGGARDAVLDIPATDARLRSHLARYESEIDPHGGHAFVGKGAKLVEFLHRSA